MASLGSAVLDQYYQSFMADNSIPQGQITYNDIATENKSDADLTAQVAASLRPKTDASISSLRSSVVSQKAALDADAASRGMTRSTYLTDMKGRLSQQEQQSMAAIESDYGATLAAQVAEYWQNQANRTAAIRTQNAANRLTTDQWNAQKKMDWQSIVYQMAVQAADRAGQAAMSGSGGGSDGLVVTDIGGITQAEFEKSLSDSLGRIMSDTVTKDRSYLRIP